ncbi:MAG: prolipoprotein diacylglyceryl transferase [Ruthenibacterium sp.]
MVYHVQFPGLGLAFDLNRVAFTVFDLPIYWYGICIALGLGLALVFAFAKARSFGIDSDRMIDVIMLSTLCAIVGARAYYVIFAPFKYESLWEMVNLRDGGIAIYGAVIGAFVSGYFFCKWRKIRVLPMFDLAAMGFLIGQAIGRWGNFFNQEAFGTNTNLPWGMFSEGTQSYLTSAMITPPAGVVIDPMMPVHPTFLYESIWCALGFFLLWAYSNRRKFDGEIALMYVMWYGIERFFVEGLRTDSLMTVIGLRTSQIVAALSALIAAALWLYLRRKNKGVEMTVCYPVVDKDLNGPAVICWKLSDKTPTEAELKDLIAQLKIPPVLPVGVWHQAHGTAITTNHEEGNYPWQHN